MNISTRWFGFTFHFGYIIVIRLGSRWAMFPIKWRPWLATGTDLRYR